MESRDRSASPVISRNIYLERAPRLFGKGGDWRRSSDWVATTSGARAAERSLFVTRNALVANLVNRKRFNTRCLNARPLRKNGRHFLRDYTRFAPRHGNWPMRADVAWSWGTRYPGRSKIRCIDTLLLFRSSGWASWPSREKALRSLFLFLGLP